MGPAVVYEPELFWDGQALRPGAVVVDAQGLVASEEPLPETTRVRLPGRVLFPGLVNAHSHAFQRVLRGRTEHSAGGHDDFWTWRDRMYRAANALDPEGLYVASRQAFLEMALAGVTSVGEFHYLQHAPGGAPYSEPDLLARQVIRAAREVGLRIVLLRVGYARAGWRASATSQQRRFVDASPEAWLEATARLSRETDADPAVRVGLGPHSVRALPRAWLEAMTQAPTVPVHMHVAEQGGEVNACLEEYGQRPVELLEALGLLSPRFTAVHAIQITEVEAELLGRAGAGVCACPSTERNLGDGVVPADVLATVGVTLSLGSDSQCAIDLIDEARQLEGNLRLLHRRRNVLEPAGNTDRSSALAARLLGWATEGGARALGLPAGTLAAGHPADFFTLDLDHPSLAGAPPETLLASLFVSGATPRVRDVAVGGRLIVDDGRLVNVDVQAAGRDFARVVKGVFG